MQQEMPSDPKLLKNYHRYLIINLHNMILNETYIEDTYIINIALLPKIRSVFMTIQQNIHGTKQLCIKGLFTVITSEPRYNTAWVEARPPTLRITDQEL